MKQRLPEAPVSPWSLRGNPESLIGSLAVAKTPLLFDPAKKGGVLWIFERPMPVQALSSRSFLFPIVLFLV